MGMVAQLADFSAEVSAVVGPLHPLLRVGKLFIWTDDKENAFEAFKKVLSSPPILATFDPKA